MQKALTLWHERMLRSDNITCITVMLDPPGLPFSDCIVKKKREKLTSSMSSCENHFSWIEENENDLSCFSDCFYLFRRYSRYGLSFTSNSNNNNNTNVAKNKTYSRTQRTYPNTDFQWTNTSPSKSFLLPSMIQRDTRER